MTGLFQEESLVIDVLNVRFGSRAAGCGGHEAAASDMKHVSRHPTSF
jgi:hypothetical protein